MEEVNVRRAEAPQAVVHAVPMVGVAGAHVGQVIVRVAADRVEMAGAEGAEGAEVTGVVAGEEAVEAVAVAGEADDISQWCAVICTLSDIWY